MSTNKHWIGLSCGLLLAVAAGCSAELTRGAMASNPDFVVFVPEGYDTKEATNEHFLVTPSLTGDFLAFWTQAGQENDPDQHVAMSRSTDRGKTWTEPVTLAGDPSGKSGRIASWQFPLVVPGLKRIYLFWNQNVGVVDAREDTTGELTGMWSDDDGHHWTGRITLPIRKSAISNPEPGSPPNWVVYQAPIVRRNGEVLVGFTRWASTKVQPEGGLFDRDSEVWFLRFDNIMTEPDPHKLKVTTLPEGDRGLRVPLPAKPHMSIAQEPSVQELSDGRLFAVMRTRTGRIHFSISRDGGRSWAQPRPLRYHPGGPEVLQPLAPCPLYRLNDGRFILIFHNNDGTANGGKGPTDSRKVRRPVFLAVGHEIDDPDQPIAFSQPRLLADNTGEPEVPDGHTQIGTYPSLFEYDGKVYFWYPDRKHYLLGKVITDAMLRVE